MLVSLISSSTDASWGDFAIRLGLSNVESFSRSAKHYG